MARSEDIPEGWIVVPRYLGHHVFLLGAIFGASNAVMVMGFALEMDALKWGWPLGVIAMYIHGWYLKRKEKQLSGPFVESEKQ